MRESLEELADDAALSCTARRDCPYTREMREWLELRGAEFVEYDVEADRAARDAHARAGRRAAHGAGAGRGRHGGAGRLAGPRLHGERLTADDQRLLGPRARRGAGRRLPAVRLPPGPRQHAGRLGAERRGGRRDPPRGRRSECDAFLRELRARGAARGEHHDASTSTPRTPSGLDEFIIRASRRCDQPTVAHLARPGGVRATACASCSIPPIRATATRTSTAPTAARATPSSCGLPYDRGATTMAPGRWTRPARASITTPRAAASTRSRWRAPRADRTTGCEAEDEPSGDGDDEEAIRRAVDAARATVRSLAVKGLGGYHLACDARNAAAVCRAARAEVPEGEAVRAHGARPGHGTRAWSSSPPRRRRCSRAPPRPIVLAPARVALAEVAPDNRRARRHAAVHAAASPAVRGGRARRAGHDQRQPLERADRLRG